MFIADRSSNLIKRIDWITRVVTTVAGNAASAEMDGIGVTAGFTEPQGLTIKNGSIWVADWSGSTVRHIGMHITIQIYFNISLYYKSIFFFCFSYIVPDCWIYTPW